MIGDKMLLYDRENDVFFSGWRMQKIGGETVSVPAWTSRVRNAMTFQQLDLAWSAKDTLNCGAHVVSLTEAAKIETRRIRRLARGY